MWRFLFTLFTLYDQYDLKMFVVSLRKAPNVPVLLEKKKKIGKNNFQLLLSIIEFLVPKIKNVLTKNNDGRRFSVCITYLEQKQKLMLIN